MNKTGTEKMQTEVENKELLIEASEPFKMHKIKAENSRRFFSFVSVYIFLATALERISF